MRFVLILLATGFAAAWSLSSVIADDIYVNNVTGDDRFNGRPITDSLANGGPVKTIGRALRMAGRGDRVVIQKTAMPYREYLTVQGARHSGTDYRPFSIISDGAILDGTSAVNPRAWEHYDGNVFRFQPELKSYQQFYLNGKPAKRVISNIEAFVPDLEEEQWTLVDGWVYFCTADSRIPSQYDLRYCKHQTGITLYEVNNVRIEGLIIQGFQLDGVNAHEAVTNTIIKTCRIRGNGRSGLSVGGASRVSLVETVVGANSGSQVRSESYAAIRIQDCRLLESDTTGPAVEQNGGRISIDGLEHLEALSVLRRKP